MALHNTQSTFHHRGYHTCLIHAHDLQFLSPPVRRNNRNPVCTRADLFLFLYAHQSRETSGLSEHLGKDKARKTHQEAEATESVNVLNV